ncbi:MAG: hypothetical protein H0X34_07520 [Chthoniobacterales bacterium]|nr:hypothetical protein [Chthoniobacterales bacterium]
MSAAIFQIVPRAPGSREGVGDYARLLATGLERNHGIKTTFVSATPGGGSWTLSAVSNEQWRAHPAKAIVLHYVNYGYHARGLPLSLPRQLRRIRQLCGGRLITIFHELYAAGSWRQSAFWLQPLQKRIARALAEQSGVCIVSSALLAEQLKQLAPTVRVIVRPVVSTFGEPKLTAEQIANRDPPRWAICGGTELIQRSLHSFTGTGELFVVGGADRPEIRHRVAQAHYLPNVETAAASAVLRTCAFGWIDYFERADVPTEAILKSTTFAAYCAHGVVPVLPHAGSRIALDDEALPGPFSLENLPPDSARPAIAQSIYEWYGRNASSPRLAATIAGAIES